MSKKVLIGIAVIAVLLVVGGVAVYVWVDYSQAQNSLTTSRLYVRDLQENIRRHPEDVGRLKEMYTQAVYEIDALERFHRTWVGEDEISALRTALEESKRAIDQLAAGPGK